MGKQLLGAGMASAVPAGAYQTRDGEGALDPQVQEIIESVRGELEKVTGKIDQRFEDMDKANAELRKGLLTPEAFEERQKEFENGAVKEMMERQDEIEKQLNRIEGAGNGRNEGDDETMFTAAKRMAETDEFKAFAERGHGTAHIECRAVTNAGIDATPAGGVLNPNQTLPGVIRDPDRPLVVRDLIPTFQTSDSKIDFVREDVFTNNADYQLAEGDLKAESDITFTAAETSVVTLAHWIPASKQVLADIPMLQSYITNRLIDGLDQKEEDEIMAGAGGAGQLNGLINQATAFNTATYNSKLPTGTTATTGIIDKIRVAKFQIRKDSYYTADGVVLNPDEMLEIDLLKDADNRYLFVSPFTGGVPRIWGMRMVEADSIAAGSFMIGAFRLAAAIFDRMTKTVMASTEDRDNFVKNMVTILAEQRLALVVQRPKAFVTGTFAAMTNP